MAVLGAALTGQHETLVHKAGDKVIGKAGLLSLARTLSGELWALGIRVNGLSPGPTETAALGKLGLPPEPASSAWLRRCGLARVSFLNPRSPPMNASSMCGNSTAASTASP
nr:SDR family oxidoreductase [Burkholderia pyrrocinia]